MTLSQVLAILYNKFEQFISTAPRGAISVTGILGLAVLVYGYLHLRGSNSRTEQQRRVAAATQQAPASVPAAPQRAGATTPAAPTPVSGASATLVGRAVASQLQGIKRVTVSIPGVLFVENTPALLQESATVRQETIEVVQEISRHADLYLLAHVEDDVGEAVVTGALEAAGLLGQELGQIKAHHVLCCSTLDGKVPIVRQIEPDLHIDAHPASIDELKRFLPRLLFIRDSGATGVPGSTSVTNAVSLLAYFGL